MINKTPAGNERFGVMAAEARRNGNANLEICTPQEVQWKPPLRQAATTLAAMRATAFGEGNLKEQTDNAFHRHKKWWQCKNKMN